MEHNRGRVRTEAEAVSFGIFIFGPSSKIVKMGLGSEHQADSDSLDQQGGHGHERITRQGNAARVAADIVADSIEGFLIESIAIRCSEINIGIFSCFTHGYRPNDGNGSHSRDSSQLLCDPPGDSQPCGDMLAAPARY